METKYIVNNTTGQTITGDLTINGNVVITGTTNTRPYKVFTALLTQSGGDSVVEITGGDVVMGVTYEIYEAAGGAEGFDFTNIGAPNNNFGTSFVATGTIPASWGNNNVGLRYNEGAPVATVLENTIGNIWFTYINTGEYYINSDALFADFKTTIFGSFYNSETQIGINFTRVNENYARIVTTDNTSANSCLNDNLIEIRVYN